MGAPAKLETGCWVLLFVLIATAADCWFVFVSVLPAGARPWVGRAAAIVPPCGGRPRDARAGGATRLDAASAPPLPLRCLSVASPLGTAVGGLW